MTPKTAESLAPAINSPSPSVETSDTEPALRALKESPTGPGNSRNEGRWIWAYVGLFAAYLAIGMALRVAGWIHGDAVWFVEAGRKVLDGSFDVYSYRTGADLFPPSGAAYAYTPFTAIIMAPFVGFAQAMGWGETGAEILISLPLLAIDILAMLQLRALARSWRPAVDERYLFAGIAVALFLTSFLGDSAYYGHNEGLQLLFLLLALRLTPRNVLLGGLCAGFALSAKHTTFLDLLPVGLVLLSGARITRRSGSVEVRGKSGLKGLVPALTWAGAAVAVFAAFMIIPLVRYPDTVYYAFVTQIARLPLFGTGLPVWVDRGLQWIIGPAYLSTYQVYFLNYANWVLFGVVGLTCVYVVWRVARAGRPILLVDSRLLGLVAFAAVAQLVLGKWVSGHYYQLPLALVFLWDLVRRAPASDEEGRATTSSFAADLFPWIGLGAPVAFRCITQFGIWWIKDLAVLALFVTLLALLLSKILESKPHEVPS